MSDQHGQKSFFPSGRSEVKIFSRFVRSGFHVRSLFECLPARNGCWTVIVIIIRLFYQRNQLRGLIHSEIVVALSFSLLKSIYNHCSITKSSLKILWWALETHYSSRQQLNESRRLCLAKQRSTHLPVSLLSLLLDYCILLSVQVFKWANEWSLWSVHNLFYALCLQCIFVHL